MERAAIASGCRSVGEITALNGGSLACSDCCSESAGVAGQGR